MKLNKTHNIITDGDITITGENKNLGNSLSEIIQSHEDSINKLKSNVKWLYKYGGVGSGTGGSGTGGSGKWGFSASLGGRRLEDGQTIPLDGAGNYLFSISISRAGGAQYSVSLSFDGSESIGPIVLAAQNGWTYMTNIQLKRNSILNIQINDGNEIRNISVNYITNPYKFEKIKLLSPNNVDYGNGDILMGSIKKDGGIKASINYSIAINNATFKYSWEFNGNTTEEQTIPIDEKSGKLEYWLFDESNLETLVSDSAGTYKVRSRILVYLENQEPIVLEDEFSFNLVPETLYLRVTPESGYVYQEIPTEEPEESLLNKAYYTNSTIKLILKIFYGSSQNRSMNIKYIKYNQSDSSDSGWDSGEEKELTGVKENTDTGIELTFSTKGWKKIRLTCSYSGLTYTVERFLLIKEVDTNYNWYNTGEGVTLYNNTSFWRLGEIDESNVFSEFFDKSYYQVNASGSDKLISLNSPNSSQIGDFLISIGIQYCEINNSNNPILSLNVTNEDKQEPFITLYQNKVTIGDTTSVDIFLGKTPISAYSPNTQANYHLVQILFKYSNTIENTDYRQACIYIDGVLEGAAENWFDYTKIISSVSLKPSNYSLNLLEVTNLANGGSRVNESNAFYILEDIDINYYYNTYLIKSTNNTELLNNAETNILSELFNITGTNSGNRVNYTINQNLLKLSKGSSSISNISKYLKIPTLVLVTSENQQEGKINFFEWLNSFYEENDTSENKSFQCPVSLRWYNNPSGKDGDGVSFTDSNLINGTNSFGDSNVSFYIQLQGSSTMRFKSKNLTLGVKNINDADTIPVFSPNFDKDDTSTFLPDTAFTLKSDMVDSSHSNNTCLGKFINKIYKDYNVGDYLPVIEGDLKNHVKSCLEGFPIIIFIELKRSNDVTEYYYLGVYNFNLGRNNLLNLGYINPSKIENLLKNSANESGYNKASINNFLYATITEQNIYKSFDNLVVAEIQGNSPFWDFSQYDESILFKKTEGNDTNYMFGDIVYGSNTGYEAAIKNFVKSITFAGHYIFSELRKDLTPLVNFNNGATESDDINKDAAYKVSNKVPSAKIQYRRSNSNKYSIITKITLEDGTEVNVAPPSKDETGYDIGLLRDCILDKTNENGTTEIASLNYKSAVLYYTICMAFGLVDSVQKNLNIKTWDRQRFGLYFYDMDTSLGTSNSGTDTSYFCYSDYWKTNFSNTDKLDDNGKIIVKNDGIEEFRDNFPEKDENGNKLPAGYDIPSSYLFAIIKYAAVFQKQLDDAIIFPQQIWGELRQSGGDLENADRFIDNYFKKHLDNVPNTLLNLNYRVKYLYTFTKKDYLENKLEYQDDKGNFTTINTNTNFNSDCGSLRGRKIEKVRDWLSSRFHILDAYFNLASSNNVIYEEKNEKNETIVSYIEPICNVSNLSNNVDIQVLHDIFSPIDSSGNITSLNRYGNLNFNVRARNYTPLIHKNASNITKYLLEDENTTYNITVGYDGNQVSKFGGSAGWTYLDSLNSFITSLETKTDLYVTSSRLEHLEGTVGEITNEAKLNIPAVKKLIMTSPNYKCTIKINESFYNLQEVDIHGSQISIEATNASFNKLIATGINSKNITLKNCTKLGADSVNITGVVENLEITPIWDTEEFTITGGTNGLEVSKLVLSGPENGNCKLVIRNVKNLTSLTFSKFKSVEISNCENLTTITNNDSIEYTNRNGEIITGPTYLTEFKVTNAIIVSNITLVSDKLRSLDLGGCNNLNNLIIISTSDTLDSLTTLKLNNTSLKTIRYQISNYNNGSTTINDKERQEININKEDNINTIEDVSESTLFLTDYPNLSTFTIKDNSEVMYIKVNNNEERPGLIIKKDIFTSCTNLRRIFGHLGIEAGNTNTEIFYGCKKFSIHGYYVTESNVEIKDLKINDINICDSSGRVLHPIEIKDQNQLFNNGDDNYFIDGENVTNISYNSQNITTSTSFSSAFRNTCCTIFDIYYFIKILSNGIKKSARAGNINLYHTFYNEVGILGSGIKFNWTEDVDNSPNRNLFDEYSGSKINNLEGTFRGRAEVIRLFSTIFEIKQNNTHITDVINNKFNLGDKEITISNNYDKVTIDGGDYDIEDKKIKYNDLEYELSIKDKGLFYYTTQVQTINTIFYGGNYYLDNNIFINKTYWESNFINSHEYLEDITYFSPKHIINGIDYLNYNDVFTDSINYHLKPNIYKNNYVGNISRIFKPIQKLYRFFNVFNSSTVFIDYGESKDVGIPPVVKQGTTEQENSNLYKGFGNSFRTLYAIGEFKLNDLFSFPDTVTQSNYKRFMQSFSTINTDISKFSGYSSLVNARGEDKISHVYTKLTNNFFDKFPYLINIGYSNTGTDFNGLTSENSSFRNFDKIIENEFPYDIISNLHDLEVFTSFFSKCKLIDIKDDEVELPGKLFIKNEKLKNISRCFENFNYKIKLTPNSLENCNLINDVSYLFYNNTTTNRKDVGIFGKIPNRFFYHGTSGTKTTISFEGTNETLEIPDVYIDENTREYFSEKDLYKYTYSNGSYNSETHILTINPTCTITKYEYSNESESYDMLSSKQAGNMEEFYSKDMKESDEIDYYKINTNLTNLNYCFSGQGFIEHYNTDGDKEAEVNENYQPYKYIYDPSNNNWKDKTNTYYNYKYTCIWYFDGDYNSWGLELGGDNNITSDGLYDIKYIYENLEDININSSISPIIHNPGGETEEQTITKKFFCPPDMFRYCTSSPSIEYIFHNCGYNTYHPASLVSINDFSDTKSVHNCVGFGITGRICHYLLKPISNITSLSNFIYSCKRLSPYVSRSDGFTYLIPKNFLNNVISVTNLTRSFSRLKFPNYCKLNIFDNLRNSLIINEIFQYLEFYNNKSQEDTTPIEDVFINNTILQAKRVFSVDNTPSQLIANYSNAKRNQYIRFGKNFTLSKLPSESTGYDSESASVISVYDGYSSNTVSFDGLTNSGTGTTTTEFRYHDSDTQKSPYNYRTYGNN